LQVDNFAWAAGLFEGEGCITDNTNQHGLKYPYLRLCMKDEDVVRKFQEVVGVGTIRFRKQQKEHWSPMWDWYLCKAADVRVLIIKMLPYFGNRRAYRALNALDDIELKS
jgi:hypothetical protein